MRDASRLRILAFEPFDIGSHRAVRESINRHSRHHWTWLTRPGRAWKWRMRLAAVELVEQAHRSGVLNQSFDIVFATSLLSAADLRALLPAAMRDVPVVLYMHENQAAYPLEVVRWREEASDSEVAGQTQLPDVQLALTNLTSVLAADLVLWNSEWNRKSFIDGMTVILKHAPDLAIDDIPQRLESRSMVIWPPVEPLPRILHKQAGDLPARPGLDAAALPGIHSNRPPIRVVWPHRWEHDKGPDELLRIALDYSEPLNLCWTILGESFRKVPPALIEFQKRLADRIDHVGFDPDRDSYWRRLMSCDWVLSTARHEFFGIAVVEALLAGCLPWLPDALSYSEILPMQARRLSPMDPPRDSAEIRESIQMHLQPALAHNAVRRIDDAIESLATRQGCARIARPDRAKPKVP